MEYWAAITLAIELHYEENRCYYVVKDGEGKYWPMAHTPFNERYFRNHRPLVRVGK